MSSNSTISGSGPIIIDISPDLNKFETITNFCISHEVLSGRGFMRAVFDDVSGTPEFLVGAVVAAIRPIHPGVEFNINFSLPTLDFPIRLEFDFFEQGELKINSIRIVGTLKPT